MEGLDKTVQEPAFVKAIGNQIKEIIFVMIICILQGFNHILVKCGHCFATHHLGMILAIILVGLIKNHTRLLSMPELHANHTVWIAKEKAQNFPVA